MNKVVATLLSLFAATSPSLAQTDPAAPAPPVAAPAPSVAPAVPAGDPAELALRLLHAMDLRGGLRESFGEDEFGRIVFWLMENHPEFGLSFDAKATAIFRRDLSAAELAEAVALFEKPGSLESTEAAAWAEKHRPLLEEQVALLTGGQDFSGPAALEIGCSAAIMDQKLAVARASAGAEPAPLTDAFLGQFVDEALRVRKFCACVMQAARAKWGDSFPAGVADEDASALTEELIASGQCQPPE